MLLHRMLYMHLNNKKLLEQLPNNKKMLKAVRQIKIMKLNNKTIITKEIMKVIKKKVIIMMVKTMKVMEEQVMVVDHL